MLFVSVQSLTSLRNRAVGYLLFLFYVVMLLAPRPASAPSGDWRSGPSSSSVNHDIPRDQSFTRPSHDHGLLGEAHPHGRSQSTLDPANGRLSTGESLSGQTIQRSHTTTIPAQNRQPLLQTTQPTSDCEDPWERKMLLTLGQSKSEPSDNRLTQWY